MVNDIDNRLINGLSPRVRGNLPYPHVVQIDAKVYPRVCGGTMVNDIDNRLINGLFPRVRGNQ